MILRVIEYTEGCGYNCETIADDGSRHWHSRRPFNRVEMQNRINRFVIDNPTGVVFQEMIYSDDFEVVANA